jgi:hypothetical protein
MTDPKRLLPDPRLSAVLADTSGQARYQILSILPTIIDSGLPFHLGLRLNADTIDAFSRLPPRTSALRLARLYPALFRRDQQGRLIQYDQMSVRDPRNLDQTQLELLNQMNVKWILSRFAWSPKSEALDLTLRNSGPGLLVYENQKARPRARAAGRGGQVPVPVQYPAPDQVGFDLRAGAGRIGAGEKIAITLADSWCPGWEARTESGPLRIQPDDLGFRRMETELPQELTMVFVPWSFRVGLFAGMASLCLTMLVGLRLAAVRGWGKLRP